jgi:hypothetical protein
VASPFTFAISATSRLKPVTGYVYVGYHAGKKSKAQVRGSIKGAKDGQVAGLYAQQFPFSDQPAQITTQVLHPDATDKTAAFSFTVTPTLETRYTVRVFKNGTSTDPLGTSPSTTVYVSPWTFSSPDVRCQRPICHEKFTINVRVPPAAMASELAKAWYPYFGLRLGPDKAPPPPKIQTLNNAGASVSSSRQTSADTYTLTIRFTFELDNKAYSWNWSACTRDTVDQNGLGVPGRHGCGDQRIPEKTDYAG